MGRNGRSDEDDVIRSFRTSVENPRMEKRKMKPTCRFAMAIRSLAGVRNLEEKTKSR